MSESLDRKWFFIPEETRFTIMYFDRFFGIQIGGHNQDNMFVTVTDRRRDRHYCVTSVNGELSEKYAARGGNPEHQFPLSPHQQYLMKRFFEMGISRSQVRIPAWAKRCIKKARELII